MKRENPAKNLAEASDRILTPREAAALLGRSVQTLAVWRCHRKGPPWILLGDGTRPRVGYALEALRQWLEARQVQP